MVALEVLANADRTSTVKNALGGSCGLAILHMEAAAAGRSRVFEYVGPESTVAEFADWYDTVEPDSADSPRVVLRPLVDDDIPALFHAANAPGSGFRWRYGGRTLAPTEFYDSLYVGTFCQFVVAGAIDGHAYGLVAAYQARLEVGHCSIAFQRCSPRTPRGEVFEGMFLFVEHLFSCFPFRKLCAEIPGYNQDLLQVQGPFVRTEGELVGHDFHEGRYWNRHLMAIWREEWDDFARPLRSWFAGPPT